MEDQYRLSRFLEPQNQVYLKALGEIKAGKKRTHWMWFIFPQLKGLGSSQMSVYYSIKTVEEAIAYLRHPVLGKHLIDITTVLLDIKGKSAAQIFGTPDYLKLHSCMTLFGRLGSTHPVFRDVIVKYFEGKEDPETLKLLGLEKDQ